MEEPKSSLSFKADENVKQSNPTIKAKKKHNIFKHKKDGESKNNGPKNNDQKNNELFDSPYKSQSVFDSPIKFKDDNNEHHVHTITQVESSISLLICFIKDLIKSICGCRKVNPKESFINTLKTD
jgi:hypothetical protein